MVLIPCREWVALEAGDPLTVEQRADLGQTFLRLALVGAVLIDYALVLSPQCLN